MQTNKEISEALAALGAVYAASTDKLCEPILNLYAHSKEEVIAAIHAIGGRFTKREGWGGDSVYFDSARIPGVSIYVDRDKICRKIPARYECEPLLSSQDETEIVESSI